jgi:shikimate kinase
MTGFVLIGMPGSGKSGLGRAAATTLGLRFVDLDEEIERRTGRTPKANITEDGEAAFRRIETETLAVYAGESLAQETEARPLILSTGGGIVTVPENLPLLRRIGTIIWIRRDLDEIASSVAYAKDRPLLQDRAALDALWEARKSLYAAWADAVFENRGDPVWVAGQLTAKISNHL